jgi:DNA-binding NarL/FixJ family response regulator
MKSPRLLLADDHALVVAGVRKLLEGEFEVVGIAEDGRALLAMAEKLRPDVILLDISMPLLNGIEAARQLNRLLPQTKLVFVTMHADVDYVTEALRAGASGYVLKRCVAGELVNAIREVLKGRTYVTPLAARAVADSTPKITKFSVALTQRQREVLQLVAEGRATKEIAHVLNVSIKTVEFHRSSISRKLGLRTTAALTKYAIDHGMVGT